MGKLGHGYGSEFHLLRWMGRHRTAFDMILEPVLGLSEIHWLDFQFDTMKAIPDAELKGLSFLEGNPNYGKVLNAFCSGNKSWPQRGELMNWDAIGQSGDIFILCEAKAHLEEIERDYDPGDSPTLEQRERAFAFAKEKFGACADSDWMHSFYQMANRLYVVALLEECGIHAILLNIFFYGDNKDGWTCPQTPVEWNPLIQEELKALGINTGNSFFTSHVKNVFLPINGIPDSVRSEMSNDYELPIENIPEGTIFSIPSYQRGYRWTGKEVEALLNDLLSFARKGAEGESYCLQPLVLLEKDRKCWVVDGQQRLTTVAIILQSLCAMNKWDIEYRPEKGQNKCKAQEWQKLSELQEEKPEDSINAYFRCKARENISEWLNKEASRKQVLFQLLGGTLNGKHVVFLRHKLHEKDEPHEYNSGEANDVGHSAFQRLNAGKTALTSSELIRALYMESGNGLDDGEKADIAKEWDLIESAMTDESFWSIWNNSRFRDVPTRMDFLFSVVLNVKPDDARHDTLLVYREFESKSDTASGLRDLWTQTLKCWWWMQSCYSDVKAFHLLGWLSTFSNWNTYSLFQKVWQKKANCRMSEFKKCLRGLVVEQVGIHEAVDFECLRYESGGQESLKRVFVLLNCLEAEKHHIRFCFELYKSKNQTWDIEHISSQTDKNMTSQDKEDWVKLVSAELTNDEKTRFSRLDGFDAKWEFIWKEFENSDDRIKEEDKDLVWNLALLDSNTNRSYKNAILPVKRQKILYESRISKKYILPCTQAAFSKAYSPHAAQMRYWSNGDAEEYRNAMSSLLKGFLSLPRVVPEVEEVEE